MRKVMLVLLMVLLAATFAAAAGNNANNAVWLNVTIATNTAVTNTTGYTSGTGLTGYDILGAHNNGGRGCAGCHAPHSGAAGGGGDAILGGGGTDSLSGSNALFGQDVSALFGKSITFGPLDGNYGAGYVEVLPGPTAAYTTNTSELRGIMMCLACHDGVVAKGQMMNGVSWEQRMNLLPSGVYGPHGIPTLLGDDSGDGNTSGYGNDHPVGVQATLGALGLVSNPPVATDALVVNASNGTINSIAPQSAAYVQFAENYGYPAIAGSAWDWGFSLPNGDSTAADAFITCTTCHNQHVMYIYQEPGKETGAWGSANILGNTYPTYFFINGPYNPGSLNNNPTLAASTTQFCRQCHFDTSNEGMGVNTVHTAY